MVTGVLKRITCEHNKTILVDVKGEGINTVFLEKCLCCKGIITDTIKVKTK